MNSIGGKKPNLLVVTRTARVGGAERIIRQLIPRLADTYDVAVAVVSDRRIAASLGGWPTGVGGLFRILFGKARIVHSHLFLPGLLVRVRRIWDGRFTWVHTVHYETPTGQRFPRLKRWIDHRLVYPATDELVAVSGAVYRALDGYPNRRLIENEVDLTPGALRAAREGGPVVGTVAMLRSEKGIDDLLRAFGQLLEHHPDARLRIAGDGPQAARLAALVRDLGLERSVALCGYVDDLDAFYGGLDVYVQPSHQESFGLATLESMRFHVPLVVAAVGNLPDLVRDGRFGVTVPRGERFVEELALAIERCLASTDEYRERSAAGLTFWRGRLKPGTMALAHRALYEDLLLPAICMVAPIVTQSTGGLQRQLYLQSRELRQRGHRVFVLQRRDERLDRASDLARAWSHVGFMQTPDLFAAWGRAGGVGDRLRGLAFLSFGLLQLIRNRHRFDIIHAHQLYSPTLIGALAKALLGKKLVVKVTASGHLGESGQLGRLPFSGLRRAAFRRIDRLVVLNETMRSEMLEMGFARDIIHLIPNCVATPEATSTQPKPDGEPYRLLFTGRLSEEKSLDTLIDAGALLVDRGVRVQIDLVGDPDPARGTDAALRSRAEALQGRVRVDFHGFQRDTAPYYLAADAFVLPSVSEGMSNSLLEALSYGLVCLVSDIAENRFLVDDGVNGLLFQQGSATSLADTVGRVVDENGKRRRDLINKLAAAARRTVEDRFSDGMIAERLSKLYAEL